MDGDRKDGDIVVQHHSSLWMGVRSVIDQVIQLEGPILGYRQILLQCKPYMPHKGKGGAVYLMNRSKDLVEVCHINRLVSRTHIKSSPRLKTDKAYSVSGKPVFRVIG